MEEHGRNMTFSQRAWKNLVEDKIKTTVNHFCRKPLNYFTESDIHSYLYHALYREKNFSRQYPTQNPTQKTILIHREYPTFFKFKKDMPVIPSKEAGKRGHYDLVVLNPEFVKAHTFDVVINKDYSTIPTEFTDKPLIAAVEFKFLIHKLDKEMLKEIEMDFQKLNYTKPYAYNRYFLLFNRFGPIRDHLNILERIKNENPSVSAVYAETYFEGEIKATKKYFGQINGKNY